MILADMDESVPPTINHSEAELENYLLESAVLKPDQLSVAKKIQARQEGPLLMVLLQLSFIDLKQFITLLDWNVNRLDHLVN